LPHKRLKKILSGDFDHKLREVSLRCEIRGIESNKESELIAAE